MKPGCCACVLVAASILTACSKSVTTPTPVPVPAPGPVRLTGLNVTGNASLTSIAETSQLMAVATFSDGAVKDVSSDTTWASTQPAVMAVSSTGLVTVVRFGTSFITARYQTQFWSRSVTATPPGTFAVSGGVDEPGQGPVADVRVIDTASSKSAQTGTDGFFSLASLSSSQVHLRFEKAGYEPAELDVTPGAPANGRIQQIVRVVAGETVTPHRLAPNDLTYLVGAGQRCNPCRLIRVVMPVKGTLHLHLTWPACGVTLGLWIDGRHVVPPDTNSTEVDADVAAGPGEAIFYVDRASPSATSCHAQFVLETSLME